MNSTLISLTIILSIGLVAWSLAELVRWIDRKWATNPHASAERHTLTGKNEEGAACRQRQCSQRRYQVNKSRRGIR